jgi:hypothetical protein
MVNADSLTPEYRFFTTDLLTNKILSEVPFSGVNYQLSLINSGSFSGTVPVDSESRKYDLYNSTMPGKTGLYILRNGICVWGGIIWSREYDLESRRLSVNANEFTSYLYHRTIWKTFTTAFSGELKVSTDPGAEATISIATGVPYDILEGQAVRIVFASELSNLNGYFSVLKNSTDDEIYINPADRFYKLTSKRVTGYKKGKQIATVRLWTESANELKIGDSFTISGANIERLNGTHSVVTVNDKYSVTIRTTGGYKGLKAVDDKKKSLGSKARLTINGSVPPGSYSVSVYLRTTIFDFVKGLIDSMGKDFTGIEFPNAFIEAGQTFGYDVDSYKVNGGLATLTTSTPHGLTASQKINVLNVVPEINGEREILEIIDENTFTFRTNTNFIAYATITPRQYAISKRVTSRLVTTYTTSTNHNLKVGDTITIENVPDITRRIDRNTNRTDVYTGNYIVTAVTAQNQFSHKTSVPADDSITYTTLAKNPNPYVISYPTVTLGTYGPYPQFADLGFTFDRADEEFFDVDISTTGVRGFNLTSVGEFLDTFASSSAGGTGFDYRIECRYDGTLNRFSRVFKFVPNITGFTDEEAEAGLKYLGADKTIFEYPGNISSFSISESAEDAMTRMFVVGNKEGLSEEASQPYSAASSIALQYGWPILDATEDASDIEDEDMLALVASRQVGESIPPIMDFSISINGSLDPVVGSYYPGQWCSIIVDDEFVRMRLESDFEPRKDALLRRIMSIKVSVPDSSTFPEKVSLDLVPELEVNGFAQ